MAGYVYKPQTHKGPVFLSPTQGASAPTIKLPDGRVVTAVRGDQAGGVFFGHEGYQYVFPKDVLGQQGAVLSFNGQTQTLGNSNMSYRGGALGSLSESSKGAIGSFGGFGGGGGFSPTMVGQYGVAPANLMGMFPSPAFAQFDSIETAPYNSTNIFDFAKKMGQFNRDEMSRNFEQSKGFALDTLETEMQSLQTYVPAAAALKRSETSIDNIFNQQQRTSQLDAAMPNVRGQLAAQGMRGETYAEGRIPDSVQDRAYELGVRSAAADVANAGGFGARSSVARKASDLMSAEQRIKLSQYGDQLLSSNINQRAAIELAPTSYSDAGQQVRVMPPVTFSQLSQANFGQANQLSIVPATAGLSATMQQEQFKTNLEQGTRQFNAQGNFQESQFNAQAQNQFGLAQFGYAANLAGAYAGAGQLDVNTGLALQQQQQATDFYSQMFNKSQDSQQIGSIANGIGSLIGSLGGISGIADSLGLGASSTTADSTAPATSALTTSAELPESFTFDTSSTDLTSAGESVPSFTMDTGASQPVLSPAVESFIADTGVSMRSAPATRAAMAQSGTVLSAAGLTTQPLPNTMPVSVNSSGQTVYASTPLVRSARVESGAELVQGAQEAIAPFNALSVEDQVSLNTIAANASDASTLATLGDYAQRGDAKGFINTALIATKQPTIDALTKDMTDPSKQAQAQGGLSSAYTAHQLYQNWGVMSPAQKALGIASLGISGYKTATGENLANKTIIAPELGANGEVLRPGITIGQGLGLLQAGYNSYSLVNNFDQMNTLQKVAGVTGNASQMASLAKSMNLLGYGPQGAAVPNVTAQTLTNLGAQAVPQYGVGAVSMPAGSQIPSGYTAITTAENGAVVAVPTPNAATAAPGFLGTAAGVAGIAAGAYAVYQGWGEGGKSGVINGALGGAAMSAGLYALGATNPLLFAGIVAASTLANGVEMNSNQQKAPKKGMQAGAVLGPMGATVATVGSLFEGGKGKDQQARDSVRGTLKKVGLVDDNFEITLSNGVKANLGIDGGGDKHTITNPSLLAEDHKGKIRELSAYDVDYTNDLDYAASMGGITLSRLLSGGAAKQVDQIGGQIANASLKSVGYNKPMTPENYNTVMTNQRLMFAKIGIKSKSDALQLLNQAYGEGRLDDTQHVSGAQALNMIFDNNSYGTARKLMDGRQAGINAIPKLPSTPASKAVQIKEEPKAPAVFKKRGESPAVFTRPGYMATPPAGPTEVNSLQFGV
jgi:hypothetical protein